MSNRTDRYPIDARYDRLRADAMNRQIALTEDTAASAMDWTGMRGLWEDVRDEARSIGHLDAIDAANAQIAYCRNREAMLTAPPAPTGTDPDACPITGEPMGGVDTLVGMGVDRALAVIITSRERRLVKHLEDSALRSFWPLVSLVLRQMAGVEDDATAKAACGTSYALLALLAPLAER